MRRKKPRVVWLPQDRDNRLGVAPLSASTGTDNAFGISQNQVSGPIGATVTEVFPVVGDAPSNLGFAGSPVESLADVTQSAYRLRRIVGKIFAFTRQDLNLAVDTLPQSQIVTAGFIVLRVNPVDGLPLQNAANYTAVSLDNNADPWIWRRSWVLTNVTAFDGLASASGQLEFRGERSNILAGSALDGPHVDAKTARIISTEERLCLVITRMALGGDAQGLMSSTVIWDLRVLGSMRSSQGNRRNASR